jgi:hypothetical protein
MFWREKFNVQDLTKVQCQKDLADIARLIEAYPELRSRVPDDILRVTIIFVMSARPDLNASPYLGGEYFGSGITGRQCGFS